MSAAHTPGPWTVVDESGDWALVMACGIDYDDLPTVEALIAGADIPARIAARAAKYEVAA